MGINMPAWRVKEGEWYNCKLQVNDCLRLNNLIMVLTGTIPQEAATDCYQLCSRSLLSLIC